MATYSELSTVDNASARYFWTLDVYEGVFEGGSVWHWLKITSSTKAVYKGNYLKYVVRVWKKLDGADAVLVATNPNRVKPLYSGNDGISVVVLDSWKTSQAANLNIGGVKQDSAAGIKNDVQGVDEYPDGWLTPKFQTEFPYYQDSKINTGEGSSKELFWFEITAKKSNVTFAPAIFVKIAHDHAENPGATDLEVLPHPGVIIPTIKFTAARTKEEIPKAIKAKMYADWAVCKDLCTKPNRWAAVVLEPDINPDLVNYYIYYWPLSGLGTPEKQFVGYDYKPGKKKVPAAYGKDKEDSLQKAITLLEIIKTNACDTDIQEDPGSGDEADLGPISSARPVDITVERTNPPSHYVTRDISLWNKIGEKALKDMGAKDATTSFNSKQLLEDSLNKGRLGMIQQDLSTAAALNKPANAKKPWGFRFTYNPTNFSYTTAMDYNIDWMLAEKDPANYTGGNVQVGFQLYLNRVADMSELDHLRGKGDSYSKNYPRTLQSEDIQGILNRGTEYDLEFLYRVLNGDPVESNNALLTYQVNGKPALTSDFGYITGTPIWLKLNNNLRYKGSIASLSVTHQMFNEYMVPIFSTVDVTMIRYPVMGDPALDKKELEKARKERAAGATDASQNPSTGNQ